MKIKIYPDPSLRTKATNVIDFGKDLKYIVEEMTPVMRELDGLGLAASQVGISKRLFIVEIPKSGKVIVAVNPKIITISEKKDVMEEGCLSIPGNYIPIARSVKVKIKALDIDGKEFEIEGENLLARALQHELDHLNGKLIIDFLSPEERIAFENDINTILKF